MKLIFLTETYSTNEIMCTVLKALRRVELITCSKIATCINIKKRVNKNILL